MAEQTQIIPLASIESRIYCLRGHKVMLDADLAELYGVETKTLVRAVKRNIERFPAHFMFQLTQEEFDNLRHQFGTSSGWGGRRYPPYVFTEQGVAMLSGVLRSKRAIGVNIAIMDTFVRMREAIASNKEMAARLDEIERKYGEHDKNFAMVFDAIRELMQPPPLPPKHPMGFDLSGQTRKKR